MNDYQTRFEALQTRFIDEPREAVQDAGNLVKEAVDHVVAGGKQDTERLRRLMQGYRDLLSRIEGPAGPEITSREREAGTTDGTTDGPTDRPTDGPASRSEVRPRDMPAEPGDSEAAQPRTR